MWQIIKSTILKDEWWVVLNTIEEIAGYLARNETQYTRGLAAELVAQFNESFERYLLGFRFIGREITPVDSNEEALAIVTALDDVSRFGGAKHHLTRAVDLLADRQTPDYPNSIKESISAVEAVVKLVTGEGTLGSGIKKLQAAGMTIHPALESGWSKLYGWTSDANGIRHAGIVPADADQALAKYMLVTCSAFVSYLIEAGRKAGLLT